VRLKALVWILRPGPSGEPEVLLLERPASRGGGEQPVTGKGEAGESAEQIAAREAREETGLDGQLLELEVVHRFRGKKGDFEEHAFLLAAPEGAEPKLSSEHIAHRWVSPAGARKALRWTAHRAALDKAVEAFSRAPRGSPA
jgi:8-oxo-dGTP pyrophosphatase MutT (NUDIX family)